MGKEGKHTPVADPQRDRGINEKICEDIKKIITPMAH
jgi:hypothetical protein